MLAFVTFFAGLKLVGPITASTLSTLEPVVTVGLAAVVLGETMGLLQLCGGMLILLAAITLIRSETRQQRPSDLQGEGSNEREATLIGTRENERFSRPFKRFPRVDHTFSCLYRHEKLGELRNRL